MKCMRVCVLLAGMGLWVGCSEAPQAEIGDARQVLEKARASEAEVYAPSDFSKANDALRKAEAEVQVQEQKFALLRNYEQAKSLLKQAAQEAEAADAAAVAGKEQAKKEAEEALASAHEMLNMALAALQAAPKGKGTAADLEVLKSDLSTAQTLLSEAEQELMASGKYLDAAREYNSIRQMAEQVHTSIQEALVKKAGGSRPPV